ncbi:WD40-repeat-containing domain protein [Leucosporidium creatinivorum]|uniref:DNA damage-binding protein CMR1 n=1 Tax=Leucosporidium creatinivorum TaxID=106004 RepID=A0A1Y2CDA6_9BASI|nr:WD40-repeat-containing domain protein [Leucosporidium creatinivorum]
MSTYAEIRQKKLEANRQNLLALGIAQDVPKKEEPKPKPVKTKAPAKRKAVAPADENVERRRSTRMRPSVMTSDELAAAATADKLAKEEEEEEKRRRKHDPRTIEALSRVTGSLDQLSLQDELKSLATRSKAIEKTWFETEAPVYPTKESVETLQSTLEELEHRGTVKITPERVYSLHYHPDTTKDLIFIGDKEGNVGLWDATETQAADDDGEGENKGRYWHWRAHQRSISSLKFAPTDLGTLYTASYDCTLRKTNLETGYSEEVIDVDRWVEFGDGLLHAFDFNREGNQIWAVDNDGGIIHRDLREPMQQARRWQADVAKIGGLSVNPINPFVGVTAHLKHDLRLWDFKKLLGMPEDADSRDINENCVVSQYEHSKACSSSYWDRSGTKVLTTSYDDLIRVFDINPRKLGQYLDKDLVPSVKMGHNCQTGAYVSVFRAHWSTCPTLPLHVIVANMDRTLDVLAPFPSPKGKSVVQLTDEVITAVPAVTASHPTREGRFAGGNSSGKISFYAPPDEPVEAEE